MHAFLNSSLFVCVCWLLIIKNHFNAMWSARIQFSCVYVLLVYSFLWYVRKVWYTWMSRGFSVGLRYFFNCRCIICVAYRLDLCFAWLISNVKLIRHLVFIASQCFSHNVEIQIDINWIELYRKSHAEHNSNGDEI